MGQGPEQAASRRRNTSRVMGRVGLGHKVRRNWPSPAGARGWGRQRPDGLPPGLQDVLACPRPALPPVQPRLSWRARWRPSLPAGYPEPAGGGGAQNTQNDCEGLSPSMSLKAWWWSSGCAAITTSPAYQVPALVWGALGHRPLCGVRAQGPSRTPPRSAGHPSLSPHSEPLGSSRCRARLRYSLQ